MKLPQRLHFIGIGGIGMSAIAQVLLEGGYQVSGSDLKPSPVTDRLARQGATILSGHRAEHVGQAQMVIRSSAVPDDNPEVQEARRRGLPILKRATLLGWLMARKRAIAVAGTHGKSTLSALTGMILLRGGMDPTMLIGADLVELGSNARLGRGSYLVAEADEFDGSLQEFKPWMAIITNIEPEHLDYYGSYQALLEAFRSFAQSVPQDGFLLLCGDDEGARSIRSQRAITYGLSEGCHWRAYGPRPNSAGGYDFTVVHQGHPQGDYSSPLPGLHNVYNALASIAAARLVGLPAETVRQALAAFRGIRRRFEVKGQARGITILDDYAHHPTEIRATLRAARERFGGRRLVCLFQPHTYSRTKLLMADFAQAFTQADEVLIADIYAARELNTYGVTSADLAAALDHPHSCWVGSLPEAHLYLKDHLQEGDVLLTMGAGDVDAVGDWILAELGPETQHHGTGTKEERIC
jgi:UDP-N-acetylmuramate--alanine ligase